MAVDKFLPDDLEEVREQNTDSNGFILDNDGDIIEVIPQRPATTYIVMIDVNTSQVFQAEIENRDDGNITTADFNEGNPLPANSMEAFKLPTNDAFKYRFKLDVSSATAYGVFTLDEVLAVIG